MSARSVCGLPAMMKAIRVSRFGGPEVLELANDAPVPKPQKGEVLVRLHAAGMNPVDTYIRTGTYHITPQLPYIPGKEAAGTVAELGENVSGWKPGDRVYMFSPMISSYAQFTVAPVEALQPLPDALSFEQGASIPCGYLTAYRALFHKGKAHAGESVLIHGATGAVGVGAVQLALAYGLTVLATGGSEAGREMLRKMGVHHVFDHRATDYADKVLAATGGKGCDIVLENLANVNLDKDLQMVAPFGRILVVGNRGRIEICPRDAMTKEVSIIGVMLWRATESETKEASAAIQAGLQRGFISPIVGKQFPLKDAAAAHDEVINSKGATGKIVLTIPE